LTNTSGESYPVGIAVGNWASANIINSIVKTVIEEVFGYHTSFASTLVELATGIRIAFPIA